MVLSGTGASLTIIGLGLAILIVGTIAGVSTVLSRGNDAPRNDRAAAWLIVGAAIASAVLVTVGMLVLGP